MLESHISASSIVVAWPSYGGIPKPAKSLLWRGFLNPLPSSVALGLSKEASDMAPPPSAPTVNVSSVVLNTRLALGGPPMPEDFLVSWLKGFERFIC
jgi:hypothetical protein